MEDILYLPTRPPERQKLLLIYKIKLIPMFYFSLSPPSVPALHVSIIQESGLYSFIGHLSP